MVVLRRLYVYVGVKDGYVSGGIFIREIVACVPKGST